MTPAAVDRTFYPLLSDEKVFSMEPINESEFLRRGYRISDKNGNERHALVLNGNTVADLFSPVKSLMNTSSDFHSPRYRGRLLCFSDGRSSK
jgi:hypothetical protein